MDIREEFETWIDDYGWSIQPDSTGLVGRYEDDRTQLAWQAWQASRTEIVIDMPRSFSEDRYFRDVYEVEDVLEAIHAAGIRTK